MKSILLTCLLLSGALARAGEVKTADCCVPDSASKKEAAVPSPRSLYQLDATWTDDAAHELQLASLTGRPVVIAMFFAHCEFACPMLVNDLRRLRASLPADARTRTRFVLVSFDSARDTPAALNAYRVQAGLDDGWTLLHGSAENVRELAMLLGVNYKQDALGQFSHSNLFTVLDAKGEIQHRQPGLQGDVSEAARIVSAVAK